MCGIRWAMVGVDRTMTIEHVNKTGELVVRLRGSCHIPHSLLCRKTASHSTIALGHENKNMNVGDSSIAQVYQTERPVRKEIGEGVEKVVTMVRLVVAYCVQDSLLAARTVGHDTIDSGHDSGDKYGGVQGAIQVDQARRIVREFSALDRPLTRTCSSTVSDWSVDCSEETCSTRWVMR